MQGKKLFDERSSSEEEDSISISDQDVQDEEDELEEAPLIHSIRPSSKLRSLRLSREGHESQTRTGSGRATDNLTASRTSGTKCVYSPLA